MNLYKTDILRNSLIPPDHLQAISLEDINGTIKRKEDDSNLTSAQRLSLFIKELKEDMSKSKTDPNSSLLAKSSAGSDQNNESKDERCLASRLGLDPNSEPWPHAWPPKGWTSFSVTSSRAVVQDVVNGQLFRSEANDFFQFNSHILGHLTHHVKKQLQKHISESNPNSLDTLIDLHCGSGLFALQSADIFKRVIGAEINKLTVQWAKTNSQINGFKESHVSFIAGDAHDILTQLLSHEHLSSFSPLASLKMDLSNMDPTKTAVIVDPPKSGCTNDLLETLARFGPKVIVYVACNPKTQSENILALARFMKEGVRPKALSGLEIDRLGAMTALKGMSSTASNENNNTPSASVVYLNGNRIEIGRDGSVSSKILPTTDLLLPVKGYKITDITPFDLFPHTSRIETVVTLVRED